MKLQFQTTLLILIFCFAQQTECQTLPQQLITPQPPMGWNSWNYFGSTISEEIVKKVADAFVSKGLKDAGYQYVVIDDTWCYGHVKRSFDVNAPAERNGRDANGQLIADPVKFPMGMKALADYVHSKGLKFGIYTGPGCATCGGYTASLGFEAIDLKTFANWGVDYIKLDNCGATENPEVILKRWKSIIDSIGRPIVLSINIPSTYDVSRKYTQLWRTTNDMMPVWRNRDEIFRVGGDDIISVINQQVGLEIFHGNGHWNDPDMLQIGNGNAPQTDSKSVDALGEQTRLVKGNMTYDENKAHFGMWAIMAAPLILGNDVINMPDSIQKIITNSEVIAINQDPAGVMATKCKEEIPGVQIWAKRLWKVGDVAVALLNATNEEKEIVLKLSDVGISGQAFFRDAFECKDLGVFNDKFTAKLPKNSILLLKISAFEPIKPTISWSNPLTFGTNPVRIEAEDVRFFGGKVEKEIKDFSGRGYAFGMNHAWMRFSVVSTVELPETANYTVTYRYINYSKKDLTYTVNEKSVILKASKKKIPEWTTVTVKLLLEKGNNNITFGTSDSNLNEVAVDYLEISNN